MTLLTKNKYTSALLFILLTTQFYKAQTTYSFSNPTFSFVLPNDWMENSQNTNPLMFGKFNRIKNKSVSGILRVGKDLYNEDIVSIWNLDPQDEKKNLEKETQLKNYSYKKEVFNKKETFKINFDVTVGEGAQRKDFKAVIYKFLVVENSKENVIFFFLIAEPKDFTIANEDLLFTLNTLKIINLKEQIKDSKQQSTNSYIIPKLQEYNYFTNSQFKHLQIKEFTKTYCFVDDLSIHDFELLVPDKLNEKPIIHFYTFKNIVDEEITSDEYKEAKVFWKSMYQKENYKELSNMAVSDSFVFCESILKSSAPVFFNNIHDSDNKLSTLVIMESKTKKETFKMVVITNYLLLNNKIVYIKLSQRYNSFSDIKEIKEISNQIVKKFISSNSN